MSLELAQAIERVIDWVGPAIVGVIITAVVLFFRNRRGNRVVVSRVLQSPQVRVSERLRSSLDIRYKGRPVENLVLNRLRVANKGRTIIESLEIELGFSPVEGNLEYWEVEVLDPLNKMTVQRKEKSFTLKRDFLNPKRAYKEEEIQLDVFSNAELVYSIVGGGKGWSSNFEDKSRSEKDTIRQLTRSGYLFGALLSAYTLLELWAWLSGNEHLSTEVLYRIERVMVVLLGVILTLAFIKVKGLDN